MCMYKKILIADDCFEEIKKLKKYFEDKNIEVVYADEPEKVYDALEEKDIDLIILDWYFVIPTSNHFSLEVLDSLKDKKYYIPVFIYSNNIDSEDLNSIDTSDYPQILLTCMKKPNPSNSEDVKRKIDKWFKSNPAVRLAKLWYISVNNAIGKTLDELYNSMGKGVINLLKQSYSVDINPQKGCSDVINLIMTITHNYMLKEKELKEEVMDIISKSSSAPKEDEYSNYEALRSLEMYSLVDNNEQLQTGDIILFDTKKYDFCKRFSNGLNIFFGVIITGECDYAHSKNLRYHKMILGMDLHSVCTSLNLNTEEQISAFINNLCSHNSDAYHYLPFLGRLQEKDKIEYAVLDFQNIISIEKDTYDTELISQRIGRIRTEYCQHLLRRYSTYSSRIGVPDIPSAEKKDIAKRIFSNMKNKPKVVSSEEDSKKDKLVVNS